MSSSRTSNEIVLVPVAAPEIPGNVNKTTSTQGSRVKLELEHLRQQQLAKSRRDKLKDCT
jgi:hypothetical protein